MPTGRKRSPPATRRRALELIAWSPDGMTEAMLLAHGLTVETMVDLIRAGLATAKAECVMAGGRTVEVTRVRITEAGRRVLAETLQSNQC
jgi:capsid protein